MIGRYTVTLDGKSLEAQVTKKVTFVNDKGQKDERTERPLTILDVNYSGLAFQTKAQTSDGLDGYELSDEYANRQTVTVTFELRLYDIAERSKAVSTLITWARDGGILRVNDRPGQYLKVRLETPPVIGSVRNWLDPLTMVFSTVGVPYWFDDTVEVKSLTGSTTVTKGNFASKGNAPKTNVTVDVVADAKVTWVKLACGGSNLYFNGLNMAKNDVLQITYTNDRYLTAKVGKTSVLNKLQPSSTDRLVANPGRVNTISVSASAKVTATFRGVGLWR